jgi:hypothetical protein
VVQQQHLDTNANAKSVKKTMRQCSECGGETESTLCNKTENGALPTSLVRILDDF